jgi:hypothetical protein
MYAIIPDIHGDFGRLQATLKKSGFQRNADDRWFHPSETKAVFLGDFIDGGTENRKVIQTVRSMMKDKVAVAIMGNHELNAILYHTPRNDREGWLRDRSKKNTDQHESFLREYVANEDHDLESPRDDELAGVIEWFKSLPLYIEFDHFRVVHAQWDDDAVGAVDKLTSDALLPHGKIDSLSDIKDGIGLAVERLLKGMEIKLPPNVSFLDYRKVPRKEMRVKWWAEGDRTFRNLALSVPDPLGLPDGSVPHGDALFNFQRGGKPVFVGHYKMHGTPAIGSDRGALCLDYPKTPCVYHWRKGDTEIREDQIVLV